MTALWQLWWVWVVAGILIGILEMLLPTGYILLGFAGGAVLTGVLIALGFAPAGVPMLVLSYAVLSALAWLIIRAVFGRPTGEARKTFKHDINDNHPN